MITGWSKTERCCCSSHSWTFHSFRRSTSLIPSYLLTSRPLLPCTYPFLTLLYLLHLEYPSLGTSLVAQWLRCHTSMQGALSSIPGQGAKFHMQVKLKDEIYNSIYYIVFPSKEPYRQSLQDQFKSLGILSWSPQSLFIYNFYTQIQTHMRTHTQIASCFLHGPGLHLYLDPLHSVSLLPCLPLQAPTFSETLSVHQVSGPPWCHAYS